MNLINLLSDLPDGLRKPLVDEYNLIVQRYMERRWTDSELSGGKFSEIVYTILDGHAKGTYLSDPKKPSNMVDACRLLEKNIHVPRGFQILIPRMLPALYEVRNNRNVGHVGGDVDSNQMDAQAVMSMCSWILGELIRVFHKTTILEAQKIVDYVTTRKIPLIWEGINVKRILDPNISLKDQIILLIGSHSSKTKIPDLLSWLKYKNKVYFMKMLAELDEARFIYLDLPSNEVEILPPGTKRLEDLISKLK